MRMVKLAFSNMWGVAAAFGPRYLLECFPCLRGHFEFELAPIEQAELVFYSVYGYVSPVLDLPWQRKLVYAGEAGDHFKQGAKLSADGKCQEGYYDYGITCAAEQGSPNHCYMPQGLLHLNLYNQGVQSLIRPERKSFTEGNEGNEGKTQEKEFFCNFIYSNGCSRDRVDFFHSLSKYKRVESCGIVERNNDSLRGAAAYSGEGYRIKQGFQARCKFSIAMENSYFPGYNTEKITDAFVAGSVPIYRGDPRIAEVFNPAAFINRNDFRTDGELVEYVRHVDQTEWLYRSYLDAPPFVGNQVPERFTDEYYLKFWRKVLGS